MVNYEPGSRTTQFYVIYKLDTLEPVELTTLDRDIPTGMGRATTDIKTAEEFINFEKKLHNYLVINTDGIAEFHPVNILKKKKRINKHDYIVMDLNVKEHFFNELEISFNYTDNKLRLNYKIENTDPVVQAFINSNNAKSDCKLYITGYGDPADLLAVSHFNLHDVTHNKCVELDISLDKEHISLWATR